MTQVLCQAAELPLPLARLLLCLYFQGLGGGAYVSGSDEHLPTDFTCASTCADFLDASFHQKDKNSFTECVGKTRSKDCAGGG